MRALLACFGHPQRAQQHSSQHVGSAQPDCGASYIARCGKAAQCSSSGAFAKCDSTERDGLLVVNDEELTRRDRASTSYCVLVLEPSKLCLLRHKSSLSGKSESSFLGEELLDVPTTYKTFHVSPAAQQQFSERGLPLAIQGYMDLLTSWVKQNPQLGLELSRLTSALAKVRSATCRQLLHHPPTSATFAMQASTCHLRLKSHAQLVPALLIEHEPIGIEDVVRGIKQTNALGSLPCIVTVFDSTGAVLYQNLRSVEYMGHLESSSYTSMTLGSVLHPLNRLLRLDTKARAKLMDAIAAHKEFKAVVKMPRVPFPARQPLALLHSPSDRASAELTTRGSMAAIQSASAVPQQYFALRLRNELVNGHSDTTQGSNVEICTAGTSTTAPSGARPMQMPHSSTMHPTSSKAPLVKSSSALNLTSPVCSNTPTSRQATVDYDNTPVTSPFAGLGTSHSQTERASSQPTDSLSACGTPAALTGSSVIAKSFLYRQTQHPRSRCSPTVSNNGSSASTNAIANGTTSASTNTLMTSSNGKGPVPASLVQSLLAGGADDLTVRVEASALRQHLEFHASSQQQQAAQQPQHLKASVESSKLPGAAAALAAAVLSGSASSSGPVTSASPLHSSATSPFMASGASGHVMATRFRMPSQPMRPVSGAGAGLDPISSHEDISFEAFRMQGLLPTIEGTDEGHNFLVDQTTMQPGCRLSGECSLPLPITSGPLPSSAVNSGGFNNRNRRSFTTRDRVKRLVRTSIEVRAERTSAVYGTGPSMSGAVTSGMVSSATTPVAELPYVDYDDEDEDGDEATGEDAVWHDLHATSHVDPLTNRTVVIVTQIDVSAQVAVQRRLEELLEHEHKVLENIFPRHVIEYLTLQCSAMPSASGPVSQGSLVGRNSVHRSGATNATSPSNDAATRPATSSGTTMKDLKQHIGKVATKHRSVTVLFADIVGFTSMCNELDASEVMEFLNSCYSRFDQLVDIFGVYKVETIGDCYMVAGGLVRKDCEGYKSVVQDAEDPLHAVRTMAFAKAMLQEAASIRMPHTGKPLQLRVGIHSGPVMSGIVGDKMPRFCLFGDTVNTASRMETTCRPGCIHVSSDTHALINDEQWEATGGVDVKGKGRMSTYVWKDMRGQRGASGKSRRASMVQLPCGNDVDAKALLAQLLQQTAQVVQPVAVK